MSELRDEPSPWAEVDDFKRRWHAGSKAGFVAVPQLLLKHQGELGLDFADIGVLVQLLSFWWTAESSAFPSRATLAERANTDERTIQRRVKRLEKGGFIEVARNGRKSNRYTFRGLREKLTLILVHSGRVESSKPAAQLEEIPF